MTMSMHEGENYKFLSSQHSNATLGNKKCVKEFKFIEPFFFHSAPTMRAVREGKKNN